MESILICTANAELLPERKTHGAVCRDLKITQEISILPWKIQTVSTWIKIRLPEWWHAKVYARSGLPVKWWIMLANSVAIFDTDYRGEYILQLYNTTDKTVTFEKFSRLAQLEFCPTYYPNVTYTTQIHTPELESIVDTSMFASFEKKFPTERWTWKFNSTWL